MPITTRIPFRRLTQSEFGDIAFEVLRHVFAIHNEIGRCFDDSLAEFESHARRLLAHADLRAIAWVNINMKQVTLTTLTP